MTPIELVLSKLEKVRKQGKGFIAQCPAHDDGKQSLGVTEADDGRVLLKCYAGCETALVCRAMGIEFKDIFPDRKQAEKKQGRKSKGRIVREYSYVDEAGVELHQTVRWDPKGFSQRHKNLKGEWIWRLPDGRKVLYHLPQLLEAKAAGREIWLCEGEKDVEALEKAGVPATCNPMGAGKWRDEYTEILKGALVCIVRDRDEPGFKHAKLVAGKLAAAGCGVRCVQAAEGKDAFDHLHAGRSLDEFEPVEASERWQKPTDGPELTIVEGGGRENGADVAPPPTTTSGAGVTSEEEPKIYHCTDHGNARRIVDRFGKDLKFCPQLGACLIWDGTRWKVDETDGSPIQRMAISVIQKMHAEAGGLEFGTEKRKALYKHAMNSESARAIAAMVSLVKKEPEIVVTPDQLDADDWVAGCPNGTLDLRTGQLRDSERSDLITKQLGVPYDPDAKCADFEKWLLHALGGDKSLFDYVIRVTGYLLTGSVREEMFVFAHGPGGGGKGTFFKVLQTVLGDYAGFLRSESLMAKQFEQIPADIAKLKGARVAIVDETEENKRFNEGLLKHLTGGGLVQARFMRENFFEFQPKFKLLIAGNHKPRIISFDRAIERRLKLIPFEHPVPEGEVDKQLKDRLASTQSAGVLALMVRACTEWQRHGLQDPQAVSEAVKEYREESDAVLRFVEECCEYDQFAENETRARALYGAYKTWSKTTEDYCGTETWFGRLLRLKGYKRERDSKGYYYVGLSLKDPQQTTTQEDARYGN
jgi:putative DNA primase/helicase